jgi:general secretion pathway protein G
MKIQSRKKQQGFTLAELMVVIVIIGLLATLVASDVMGIFTDAKLKKVKSDIQVIDGAITTYALRNSGVYPQDLQVLIEPDPNGHRYLDRTSLPKDPWQNEYLYEPPMGADKARVWTNGRDGVPGGEGEDADYDSWKLKGE